MLEVRKMKWNSWKRNVKRFSFSESWLLKGIAYTPPQQKSSRYKQHRSRAVYVDKYELFKW
jgi:hypothetical protein